MPIVMKNENGTLKTVFEKCAENCLIYTQNSDFFFPHSITFVCEENESSVFGAI